jgi:predicted dehydrogenase
MTQETLRFGVVGLGEFGEMYLACLQSLAPVLHLDITAVCSRSPARAQELAERYGIAGVYTDAEALAHDPAVDVVCVVTAEADHHAPVITALRAGKEVIVEKPLATNLGEARSMIETARATGRQLLVGHLLRYQTMYLQLHEQVKSGQLGEPVSIHTRRNRPGSIVSRYRRTHPVLETGILDIDVMLWLTGSRVKQVTAVSRTIVPGPTPDLFWGMLEFANGCIGVLETSWLGPSHSGVFADDFLSVIGRDGTARLDPGRAPLALWNGSGYLVPDTMYSPVIGGEVFGALRTQMIAFVTALRSPQHPHPVPLDEVAHGLQVALALIAASERGETIDLLQFGDYIG